MKLSKIEEQAGHYLQLHIWDTDYRSDDDVLKAFQAGAQWALGQVRKEIVRYDSAFELPARIELARLAEFCTVEGEDEKAT